MDTRRKFKIIKRKVLKENSSQNTNQIGLDDDLRPASQSSAKKSSFNENSFSIFDLDPEELKNTLKESSQHMYPFLKRSQQSIRSILENVSSNQSKSDIENVDSRLESILSRYKGNIESESIPIRDKHLSSSTQKPIKLESYHDTNTKDPDEILKSIRQRYKLVPQNTDHSFYQTIPVQKHVHHSRNSYVALKTPTSQSYPISPSKIPDNMQDMFTSLQKQPSENSVASMFIDLKTKSIDENVKQNDFFQSTLDAASTGYKNSSVMEQNDEVENQNEYDFTVSMNGKALTLEALHRTPDRNTNTIQQRTSGNHYSVKADLIESSTQTLPDIIMQSMPPKSEIISQTEDSKIDIPLNQKSVVENSVPEKTSLRNFIREMILDLVPDSHYHQPTQSVISCINQVEQGVQTGFNNADASTQVITNINVNIETQTLEFKDYLNHNTAIDFGTQTVNRLYKDAANQAMTEIIPAKTTDASTETHETCRDFSISCNNLSTQTEPLHFTDLEKGSLNAEAVFDNALGLQLEDIVLKILKREWSVYEKKINISSHLKPKDLEYNNKSTSADPTKPRTEFQFDPERALPAQNNLHVSVDSIHQDIISDIDSIDELGTDLDSHHEKRLLAKMEQNRNEILERTSEDVSLYENSDIYSDISRNQRTTSPAAVTKEGDVSSDLSSLVELSPSNSEENFNVPSVIKLHPNLAKRVSLSSPAPVLLPNTIAPALNTPLNNAKDIEKRQNSNALDDIDIDDIPEVAFSDDEPLKASNETQSEAQSIPIQTIPIPNTKKKLYDEDSFDDISEISLPGLETAQKAQVSIQKPTDFEIPESSTKDLDSNKEKDAPPSIIQNQARIVTIDEDLSKNHEFEKIISDEEKKRYEKEIAELKLRIHKIERDNNDMVIHASEKLKQYEYLESLAKSEMLNYPNKTSSTMPHKSSSPIFESKTPENAIPNNNLSIYKLYDALKKDSESKIENLNIRLKEEMSKTARFTVLKIQNEDQEKEIQFLEEKVKELKEQILNMTDKLFITKNKSSNSLCNDKQLSKSELGSKKDLGDLGFVHEQKKKWQESAKSNSNLEAIRFRSSSKETPNDQELAYMKSELDKAEAKLKQLNEDKIEIEARLHRYQKCLEDITSLLAISNLTFEQKDAIMVDIQKMEESGDFFHLIKENLKSILENIHESNLQEYEKDQNYKREIEDLKNKIVLAEKDSLTASEKLKEAAHECSTKISGLESEIQQLTTTNKNLTSELISKEASLKRAQSLWETCQNELDSSKEILKSLQVENEILSKKDTQNEQKYIESDQKIKKLQQEQEKADIQSAKWKKELESQITTSQALQKSLEESTNSLRELSVKAFKCDELEKKNSDLLKNIEALQLQIKNLDESASQPLKDLDLISKEKEDLKNQLFGALNKQKELAELVESEKKNSSSLIENLDEAQEKFAKTQNEIEQLSKNIQVVTDELRQTKEQNLKLKQQYDEILQKNQALIADHTKAISLKEKENSSIENENSKILNQVKQLQESLEESKRINFELNRNIKLYESSANDHQIKYNHLYQELIQKNQTINDINIDLTAKLSSEKKVVEELRQHVLSHSEDLEKMKSDLEFVKEKNKAIQSELDSKQKELDSAKLMNNSLKIEDMHLNSNQMLSANAKSELELLRNQLALNEKEMRQLQFQTGKTPKASDYEENEIQLLQNEKFKLECSLKMTERELFNEKNRFQNENLKWQETEHKCSAIERTNQLLESELRSIRFKYEHLLGEQTKLDINAQATVLQLQSKISEQRQMIQDLQNTKQENQALQAEINQNNQKMSQLKAQKDSDDHSGKQSSIKSEIIIERLSSLESDIRNIKLLFHQNAMSQNQKPNENQAYQTQATKQNINEEFEQAIKEVSNALNDVFQLRRDVDHERQISQNIMQKSYEARLEALKKQIKRRC